MYLLKKLSPAQQKQLDAMRLEAAAAVQRGELTASDAFLQFHDKASEKFGKGYLLRTREQRQDRSPGERSPGKLISEEITHYDAAGNIVKHEKRSKKNV